MDHGGRDLCQRAAGKLYPAADPGGADAGDDHRAAAAYRDRSGALNEGLSYFIIKNRIKKRILQKKSAYAIMPVGKR